RLAGAVVRLLNQRPGSAGRRRGPPARPSRTAVPWGRDPPRRRPRWSEMRSLAGACGTATQGVGVSLAGARACGGGAEYRGEGRRESASAPSNWYSDRKKKGTAAHTWSITSA
uniref:Uncharacterized protein n=1 Tax=Triticum urartu TaxID=4572 RepID=A0A8R7P8G2_TRIUA